MSAVRNSRAVMESRIEPEDSLDNFPSAPWWGRAVGEILDRLGLPRGTSCEEPAAGEGHLAHGLADVFTHVVANDIWLYPPRGGVRVGLADYLATPRSGWRPDWTVTNPPFGAKVEPFIRKAVASSRYGAVMFLRVGQQEGEGRLELFRDCGLVATVVLPRRGSGLRKGLWQPWLSSAAQYVVFVFVRPGAVPGWPGWRGEARQLWLDWHAADRLTRDSDAAFAGLPGHPLPLWKKNYVRPEEASHGPVW